ncbi:HAD-like domain-containing protein [Calycina marina]|uniref:HAD-like domain-containing protein n=1 Tax=Calycina marina TaxID=1763456 RepID=A0A9P7Z3D0_9HELO|nr:HAD-like domain-containing protein [Calycina marina]
MSPSLEVKEYLATAAPIAKVPNFAFAFDIDGVLYRSGTVIPGAKEALRYLYDNNIPFILLTNSGGKHESDRVLELSKKFGVSISEENFVQSHTPFKTLAEGSGSLADKTILVAGGDEGKCRVVAEQYGFKSVVTPGDLLIGHPEIWPFNQVFTMDYYRGHTRTLPCRINFEDSSKSLQIHAIFVFSSPRDWGLDTQVIVDVLTSRQGILGTRSVKNGDTSLANNGWQQDGQPTLYFSHSDLEWSTSYNIPRFGLGAFESCLEGVWSNLTDGQKLKRIAIGKPAFGTYDFAEKHLIKYRNELLGRRAGKKQSSPPLQRVFMVGDNPQSDIAGANNFNSPRGVDWTSILVNTGVHTTGSVPAHIPDVNVDDVLGAVKWALKQQGWIGLED